jgi:hypothetical protein
MLAQRWWRFVLVQCLQIPCIGLAYFGLAPWALWTAALIGSAICAGGTDSSVGPGATLARWLNRCLLMQAIAWLSCALIFGLPI